MIRSGARVTWLIEARDLDHGRFAESFQEAEGVGASALYFDVYDGRDSSVFGFDPRSVALAKRSCTLDRMVHLRVSRPERHVAAFVEAGAQTVVVPVESRGHLQRTLAVIREAGAGPAIAINPGTPLTKLQYVLPFVDGVFMLSAEPGARDIASSFFERIEILKRNLDHQKSRVKLIAGGLRSAGEVNAALEHGASGILVSGSDPLDRFREYRQITLAQN